ncbi:MULTISPECIES: hypothetical protein [unclassified Streptomyces]|uniref:hypothetical protein n=1 Tax=unclassified Streptomyces TaxID=2593676 RepID=UPI0022583F4D|nr:MULTISPECIES: hypothetical protein [unclassified Streptomyces]MCX4626468.1 hypothetical protein [Streptomyces sp. NBC_01443]WSW42669.1 hypothetical protein OG296_05785 [Streptomyces sp. NBC_01001]
MITGILSEVGRHVSSRWFRSVLLPGLLLVLVAAAGFHLGHAHALDAGRLSAWLDGLARRWRATPARAAVDIALVLLAAGTAGTVAGVLGRALERLWLAPVEWGAARRRRRRALQAAERADAGVVEAYLPRRHTWMSDRARLVETRIRAQYWFDAAAAWPRVWLLVADEVRQPVQAARTGFAEAVTLAGWGCLYLVTGVWWWPGLIAGGCVLLAGWRRSRAALEEFSTLIEAVLDIHHRDLAAALGVVVGEAGVTEGEGRRIDDILRKGAG